jgi:hypothetical protein
MSKEYDYEKMSKEGYECDCVAAGFCPLLQKEMTEPLHHLCQTSEKHRTVFLRTAKKRGVHDNDVKKRYARKTRQRTDLENTAEEAIKEMKAAGVDIDKQSEGLGDTIEKVLTKFGINQEKIEKILGGPGCGCSERKTWFNKIFSYKKEQSDD